jgi:hypothetical protein
MAQGKAPVDATEMARIEDMLKRTKSQREGLAEAMAKFPQAMGAPPVGVITSPPRALPHTERCALYGASTLVPLSTWIRYCQSVVRRVRFPVAGIVGARLVAFNATRPHDHLPPAKVFMYVV